MRSHLLFAVGAGLTLLSLDLVACSGDDTTLSPTGGDAATDSPFIPIGDSATPIVDSGTDSNVSTTASNVLYVESNDPASGANSIFAYSRGTDGSLTAIAGSPFSTGGTGVSNPLQGLGPDDTDYEITVSPDHTKLFAVNAGSDTIAVFDIAANGSLSPIAGSPFASGGMDPVSMTLAGNFMIAVNQDQDPARAETSTAANYATLSVAANGALSVASGVTPVTAGKSPQMALATPDGKLVFGIDFMAASPIRSFSLGATGALTPTSTDPLALPAVDDAGVEPPALGLALNPNNKVLYVGYVLRSEIGAYTYDASGAVTFASKAAVSGGAPCWIRLSKDGKFMYVTDTIEDQVSVLSVSADGITMSEIQKFNLADPGPLEDAAMPATSSESYQEELSPDGKFLYVVSERTTLDTTYASGNIVHVLAIDGTTGTLTETAPDVKLSPDAGVPITARTQGLVVF